ncbi:MAG: putative toxin-antitoxin system toxin component, PIN family [Candidatus Dactylopiibacterium carminicum]|uniref:Toxin-antitoxin system toxin component, PIN family n=1 Tax=Candidatus Dactylopiibacterium carminicum TaxID=857335 RepID=A0A272ET88_9RHOO|nr:putative toxin-antitoxin system toxin component, PIN family [Candidatus Dactylopiibacterium carminicum]KAF7599329.1 putative toxin-antitoxin system toxin component, PIN family [Candidatus Dactylopiibacterium carminicum]PAS93319.1 MAG: putative toxin-antitoxin system toxin component, PIN family [Candidatus Dactylopiibacterium carminicum]PAS94342.1 MAG: putative toxin-antitoxin system toxin component, PIN family [Candidatus Dactylopiibacterium carminicum]PAS99332.1 MAG: putative toxin-antitoxi
MQIPPLPFDPKQPHRLVLDTNVIMALWHFTDPALAALRTHVENAPAELLTREDCLGELLRVLAYPQFGITEARQQQLFDEYQARSLCLPDAAPELIATLPRCRDRDDQKFLALAWQGEAQALVTRDKQVLALARKPPFRDCLLIITPERLQAALAAPDAIGQ